MPIEVYLGMGPIFYNNGNKKNEYKRSAINPGSTFNLTIEYPKSETSILEALFLIREFGCIGSRSRNGWGSLGVTTSAILVAPKLYVDFNTAMSDGKKYPHVLGVTEGNLLAWETIPQVNYITAWHQLAQIYLAVKTSDEMKNFGEVDKTDKDKPDFVAHTKASARHLLGYPVTHHKINDETWGEKRKNYDLPKKIEGRFASPLRLIIKKKDGAFVGRILHIPYSVHMNYSGNQETVWHSVHNFLDNSAMLSRMEVK
jgi:CRISPR-associated protein Cmr1